MHSNHAKPLTRHVYLIVLADYLVTQDLVETVSDHDPDAALIKCRTMDEAVDALEDVERIAVAFVHAAPSEMARSSLPASITSRGGRLVLIGDDAEECSEPGEWTVLQRPFSMAMVQAHLAGTAARCGSQCPDASC